MPIVARFLDLTKCPAHGGGVIITGDLTVWVCFRPVARKGDKILCRTGDVDTILQGDETILIGGEPVACKGDPTEHGGIVLTGCPRVKLGGRYRISCVTGAAKKRSPFIRYNPGRREAFIAVK